MIFLNWKANGNKSLLNEFNALHLSKNVVLMLPHHLLGFASGKYCIGAQSVSHFQNGAYTGEMTATMLAEMSVKYCLVGHSERRNYNDETNEIIAKQVTNLLNCNIVPVLCIGENLEERKQNVYLNTLKAQLTIWQGTCIIAYEPIWSIGTGMIPMASEINEISDFVRKTCNGAKVLYGGSVSSENIPTIKSTSMDGVLVGGSSLKINEVMQMASIWK